MSVSLLQTQTVGDFSHLRFSEKCPNCGRQEDINWRPRMMTIEQDIVEAENAPELANKLTPGGAALIEGQYVYYMTRTGVWIYRILKYEYDANGQSFKRRPKTGNNSARASQLAALNRNISQSQTIARACKSQMLEAA